MTKKITALLLSIIILSICVIGAPLSALADTKYVKVTIDGSTTSFTVSNGDISSALNDAFSFCKSNATSTKKATIKTPIGSYITNGVIRLASNTKLDLTDTTLIKNNSGDANILVSPQNDKGGYSSLVNFTLYSGTLKYSNDYNQSHCLMRLAHANNIVIDSTSFLNSVDSHDIEMAACKSTTIKNCTFSGQSYDNAKTSLEALQIDILEESQHFVGMYPYDDTMNSGITVDSCTFKNLYRAIGTHSIFAGLYQTGIKITNNTFSGIKSTAISCSGYINSTIKNNIIKNCGEGIHFYMMKNDATLSSVCKPNVKAPARNTDCNTVISSNTISVKANEATAVASPIYIFGNNVTQAKSKAIPAGNYFVGNITVSSNTITTDGYGVRLYDVRNSSFKSNTITYSGKTASMYGFLSGAASQGNAFTSNKITGFEGGFNIKEASTKNTISSNTITSSTGNAVILQDTSGAKLISSNTINGAAKVGILIKDSAKVADIKNNKITSCTNGISCYNSGGNIKDNTFTSNKDFGLYIAETGKASVYNNTYSKIGKGKAYAKGTKTSYAFGNIATPSFKLTKNSTGIRLGWTAPKESSTYHIYRATSKNGTYSKIGTVSSSKTKFYDKKAKKGKTYYYKIQAVKAMNSVKAYSSSSAKKYIKR